MAVDWNDNDDDFEIGVEAGDLSPVLLRGLILGANIVTVDDDEFEIGMGIGVSSSVLLLR